jgi:deazaflavin-dependent oxidoreductase (nitroreductase family)
VTGGGLRDFREINRQLIEQFRASGGHGELGPVHYERLVLLTTIGRSTGQPHTVPLGYVRDSADNLVLFASNMGAPRDPQWYRNVAADQRVHVEITGAEWDATARITSGAQRDAAYRLWITAMPHVAGHQHQAGRQIQMVIVPPG